MKEGDPPFIYDIDAAEAPNTGIVTFRYMVTFNDIGNEIEKVIYSEKEFQNAIVEKRIKTSYFDNCLVRFTETQFIDGEKTYQNFTLDEGIRNKLEQRMFSNHFVKYLDKNPSSRRIEVFNSSGENTEFRDESSNCKIIYKYDPNGRKTEGDFVCSG